MTELRIRRVVSPQMLAVLMGGAALLPVAIALAMGRPALDIYLQLYRKVVQSGVDTRLGLNLLQGSLGLFALLFMVARQRASRLLVSAQGIELQINNPVMRLFIKPWRLVWGQVSEIVLRGIPAAQFSLDIRIKGGTSRKLNVMEWVYPGMIGKAGVSSMRNALRKTSPRDSTLLSVLAGYGIEVVDQVEADAAHLAFALEKNRYTRAGLIVLAVLATYACADGIVMIDEAYAEDAPLPAFLFAGVTVAVVGIVLFLRAGVPIAESIGLGALIGAVFGFASYPATLRVNALSDLAGMQHYEYVLKGGGMLYPQTDGPPALYAPISREFWAGQRIGTSWDIELRHGGLGIWQYRRDPLLAHVREYHERKRGK